LTFEVSCRTLCANQTMRVQTKLGILGGMSLALIGIARDVDVSKLPPPSMLKDLTYQADIKPILDKSCVKCHSGQKPKAKLRLDSLAGVLNDGHDGKVIQPGVSSKSLLVINVAHLGDKDDWMPPPANKLNIPSLTSEQIGLIRAWIDQGAK